MMSLRHTLRKYGLYPFVLVVAAFVGRLIATVDIEFGVWIGL